MDPIHPIVPGQRDIAPVAPVVRRRVGEDDRRREQERRERERRGPPPRPPTAAEAGKPEDDAPHVDVIA
jgi:hypothetical protein